MEDYIVSAALFFVLVLLSVVVYENRAMLRASSSIKRGEKAANREAPMSGEMESEETTESSKKRLKKLLGKPLFLNSVIKGTVSKLSLFPKKLFGKTLLVVKSRRKRKDGDEIPTDAVLRTVDVNEKDSEAEAMAEDMVQETGDDASQDNVMENSAQEEKTLGVEEGASANDLGGVESASEAIMPDTVVEDAVEPQMAGVDTEKIIQLEETIENVNLAVEELSEEMKDILGTIRVSIDSLDSRLSKLEQEPEQGSTDTQLDEEVKAKLDQLGEMQGKISRLERNAAEIKLNSMSAKENIQILDKRLDIVSGNMQHTLGYGIERSFICETCGKQGCVVSPVKCSKCGTESWWGWWPPVEENEENMEESSGAEANELAEGMADGMADGEKEDAIGKGKQELVQEIADDTDGTSSSVFTDM